MPSRYAHRQTPCLWNRVALLARRGRQSRSIEAVGDDAAGREQETTQERAAIEADFRGAVACVHGWVGVPGSIFLVSNT